MSHQDLTWHQRPVSLSGSSRVDDAEGTEWENYSAVAPSASSVLDPDIQCVDLEGDDGDGLLVIISDPTLQCKVCMAKITAVCDVVIWRESNHNAWGYYITHYPTDGTTSPYKVPSGFICKVCRYA